MGKRELAVCLCLSSWCLAIVMLLFFTMPRVYLQFATVVSPDHTNLLRYMGVEKTLTSLHFCAGSPQLRDNAISKRSLYHALVGMITILSGFSFA